MKSKMLRVMIIVLTLGFVGHISAKPLSIYDIQYIADANGTNPETGILEQYTAESDGIDYDYYQLLTTETESFIFAQIANLDGDFDVDLEDFCIFMDSCMVF